MSFHDPSLLASTNPMYGQRTSFTRYQLPFETLREGSHESDSSAYENGPVKPPKPISYRFTPTSAASSSLQSQFQLSAHQQHGAIHQNGNHPTATTTNNNHGVYHTSSMEEENNNNVSCFSFFSFIRRKSSSLGSRSNSWSPLD
jgi:hypothetical protein